MMNLVMMILLWKYLSLKPKIEEIPEEDDDEDDDIPQGT